MRRDSGEISSQPGHSGCSEKVRSYTENPHGTSSMGPSALRGTDRRPASQTHSHMVMTFGRRSQMHGTHTGDHGLPGQVPSSPPPHRCCRPRQVAASRLLERRAQAHRTTPKCGVFGRAPGGDRHTGAPSRPCSSTTPTSHLQVQEGGGTLPRKGSTTWDRVMVLQEGLNHSTPIWKDRGLQWPGGARQGQSCWERRAVLEGLGEKGRCPELEEVP